MREATHTRGAQATLPAYGVRVIANPQAGKDVPFFDALATAFGDAGVRWNLDVTNEPGEEAALVERAVAEGAHTIVAFGGDGTVSAVAEALAGSETLLGILPGGTANVFARDAGVPLDLAAAARLIAGEHAVRSVDIGEARFDDGSTRSFVLRVSIGLEATAVEQAPRQEKERLGELAYVVSALRQMPQPPVAHYRLEGGGRTVELDGLFAVLANSGHMGIGDATYAPGIRIDDGVLDGLIAPAAVPELVSAAAAVLSGNQAESVERLSAPELRLVCDPPQRVTVDGEPMGDTPVAVKVRPGAVRVIVPVAQEETT